MNDDIKYIRERLDRYESEMTNMALILERLTVSVEHHVRRTDVLQKQVTEFQTKMNWVEGIWRLITATGVVVGILKVTHFI